VTSHRCLAKILAEQRRRGGYVIERVSRIPGIKMRRSNDWHGELRLTADLLLPSQELRDRILKAMKAENLPMERPTAAVVLPAQPPIANKAVPHPAWPTFNSPRQGNPLRRGECSPYDGDMVRCRGRRVDGRLCSAEDLLALR
jgi:hypothetical protein